MPQANPSRRGLLSAIALGALLVILAILQYRWIGEVSAAETERLRATASRAAQIAARSFDEHIGELFFALAPELTEQDRLSSDSLTDPELLPLVDAVLQIEMIKRAPASQERPIIVRRWDEANQDFVEIPPDFRLRPLLRFLRRDPPPMSRTLEWMGEVEPSLPALVMGTGPRRSDPRENSRRVYVIVLDRVALGRLAEATLVTEIEQTLGSDIGVRIVDHGGRRLFEQPALLTDLSRDALLAQQSILAIRPSSSIRRARIEGIARRLEQSGRAEPPWLDRLRQNLENGDEEEDWSGPGPDPFGSRDGAWTLELWNPTGSLESLVASTRRRNLLVGTAVLVLLALATFQLWRSAQTERATARRQLDFVAGITHELHTPLAAITSAGANLADGVVAEPERIREYGSMIQREGHRLDSLVRQSLELAGLESGKLQPRRVVEVGRLLDRTQKATELICAEMSVDLRVDGPEQVRDRTVEVDEDLLLRALGNLISNSAKHGAHRVVLEARNERRGVLLAVEDDGPGIPEADRRFLFEPYRRGANARGKGAGLGLYLSRRIAESLGGSLRFISPDSGGARFELRLPTTPA